MEKYLIQKSTLEILDDIPPTEAGAVAEVHLGILGNSSASYWNADTISDTMESVLEGIQPASFHLPTDGMTSLYLQVWGEKKSILTKPIEADWIRLGRRARALRDSRIIKESTHLVFFVGSKSDYYEKIAIREAKKGKVVFTIDSKTKEIVNWVI